MVPTCFIIFYVLSFKILKKNTIILPCDTGAPQWRKLRREEEDEISYKFGQNMYDFGEISLSCLTKYAIFFFELVKL